MSENNVVSFHSFRRSHGHVFSDGDLQAAVKALKPAILYEAEKIWPKVDIQISFNDYGSHKDGSAWASLMVEGRIPGYDLTFLAIGIERGLYDLFRDDDEIAWPVALVTDFAKACAHYLRDCLTAPVSEFRAS